MPVNARYISGIVIIDKMVDKRTITEALSPSPPKLMVNITVLVALGIDMVKNNANFIGVFFFPYPSHDLFLLIGNIF